MDFFETCGEYYDYCLDYILGTNWFTIFIYLAIFIALYNALKLETKDLFCPHPPQPCKIGNCSAIEAGKLDDDDDYKTILQKIRISSRYDESSVYWRRAIIFTVLLLFILLILILRRLPNGYEILVAFIVIYLFTFLFLVYYQEVLSKQGSQQVRDATYLLERKYFKNSYY